MTYRPFAIAAVLSVATAIAAFAHGGATGIVMERMEAMKSIATEMKTVAEMIRGQAAFDANRVSQAADEIAGHADEIADMFPEGTAGDPSEALPSIWENWDRFVDLTQSLKREANGLSVAAANAADARDIGPQFTALGKTCSTCHAEFRKAN